MHGLQIRAIGDFLSKKQIFSITSVSNFDGNKGYSFVAIGQLDNRIYVCKVLKTLGESNARLHIKTTKIYSNKEIKKNIKYYNDIYEKGLSHPDMNFSLEENSNGTD